MGELNGVANFSGKISMNPEKLYNIALNGVDLQNRVNANFQSLNDVFDELINSVQTPELNAQLKSLYDTFRKVENDFDRNEQIINEFFENQLQDYNKHAQNITEATTNLSGSIDYGNNGTAVNNTSVYSSNEAKTVETSTSDENETVKYNTSNEARAVEPNTSSEGEPTKVYTYTEKDGLREATNVSYISDYDLRNDTAFGVGSKGSNSAK